MKLTGPVLSTKECCHEHAGEIFYLKPATPFFLCHAIEWKGVEEFAADKRLSPISINSVLR
jgi:hypothetical protein